MKIKITSNPITPYGDFTKGQILTDEQYPVAFLNHLVDDAGAAERLDYETKIDEDYEPVKKPRSTQSSQPARASRKKIASKRKTKQ